MNAYAAPRSFAVMSPYVPLISLCRHFLGRPDFNGLRPWMELTRLSQPQPFKPHAAESPSAKENLRPPKRTIRNSTTTTTKIPEVKFAAAFPHSTSPRSALSLHITSTSENCQHGFGAISSYVMLYPDPNTFRSLFFGIS
jgi:hypothetical protein